MFSLSALAINAADSSKINGYISDSMCGAKHAGSGSDCVKKCIQGGMKPVFVDDKKIVWAMYDWNDFGPATAIQVLDDPGVPENPGDLQR